MKQYVKNLSKMREIRNIQGYKQYMKHLSDISDKWITTIEYILQIIRNAYTDKMSNFDNIPFIDANLSEQIKYKINVFLHGTFESISSDIIQELNSINVIVGTIRIMKYQSQNQLRN